MRIDVDVALVNPKPFATPLRPSQSVNTREPLVVMHLSGALVQGVGVYFFLDQIRQLLGRGIRNFVIDLLEVGAIDTRGVGGLASAYNSVRDVRGRIKYVLNSEEVLSAISRSHLDRVFEIFTDEDSAIPGL